FSGETREVRINEFIEVNRNVFVVGLREGTMLLREDNALTLIGNRNARIFKYGESPRELSYEDDFTFLLSESE
ncbi:MAG: dipeptidase PepE, partial [Dysgonamonadaceae bacterium]